MGKIAFWTEFLSPCQNVRTKVWQTILTVSFWFVLSRYHLWCIAPLQFLYELIMSLYGLPHHFHEVGPDHSGQEKIGKDLDFRFIHHQERSHLHVSDNGWGPQVWYGREAGWCRQQPQWWWSPCGHGSCSQAPWCWCSGLPHRCHHTLFCSGVKSLQNH